MTCREDKLELEIIKKAIQNDILEKMENINMSYEKAVQEFRVRMRRNGWVAPYTGASEIKNFRRFTGKCPLLDGFVIIAPVQIRTKTAKYCSFSCPQLSIDGFCKYAKQKLSADLFNGAYKRDARCVAYDMEE